MPDQYTIRARVIPALLVALPLGLATLAWFPDGISGWTTLWGLAIWCGATVLLGQFGRDAGRRKQPYLFQLWGGPPTTKRLRHSGGGNSVTRDRVHKKLNKLMNKKLPTADDEAADPQAADETYEACTAFLRGKTRDHKKFNLIFEDNCDYGFRRNLWGLKPVGVAVTILALASVAALPVVEPSVRTTIAVTRILVPGGLTAFILLGWVFVVTPRWVEVPANAYAEHLLEATDQL